jgi:hypothetical protein
MNYKKMRDAPMNYQLDQNRAFNHQRQPFSLLPSVKGVKTNGQRVTWPSHSVLPSFSSSFPPWTTTIFFFPPYELPLSSNRPPCKMAHDPLTVSFNPSNWRKGGKWLSLVVECSILVELVVHGSIAYFLIVHGRKSNYPNKLFMDIYIYNPRPFQKVNIVDTRRSSDGIFGIFFFFFYQGFLAPDHMLRASWLFIVQLYKIGLAPWLIFK